MRIIGLTGGIASGKSTVAAVLTACGAAVIDADQLSREAVQPGSSAFHQIIATFGSTILQSDGDLDRKALGKVVFADPAARRRLEAITHPAIRRLAEQKLAALRAAGTAVVFYMAPLLIEAGATDRVDEIWVVYVDRETQLTRLMARDGLSHEEAEQRIAAQMPMAEKASYGSVVIDNRGAPEATERQVRHLWAERLQPLMN